MAAALCLVMAGCEDGQPSSQVQLDRGPYEDGVYLVYAPEYDADGWQEYGAITVSDGYIAQVEYDARNEVGEKKSQDTAYRDRMAAGNAMNGLPAVYPEKAYRDLIASFQQAQYDVEEVDTVAGATLSSERFRTVMAALLDFVQEGVPGEKTLPLYQDGVYEVQMPEGEDAWRDFIQLTIEQGEVSSIVFDSRDAEGNLKSADAEYKKSMIAGNVANGLPETYPEEYARQLVENFQAAGSVEQMDGVAGATVSSRNFKKLLGRALENAKKGQPTADVAPVFEDGTYRAQMPQDDQGWTEFVVLTIQDNAIAQITFDAEDENGAYKSKDDAYKAQMQQSGAGTDPSQFYPQIIQEFIQKQYLPDEMETVAGATQSSQNFKKLVTAALEQALYGAEETVQLEE